MKYLFDRLDWQKIEFVGFDMDGTIYDELEFIIQPYKEISRFLSPESFNFMINRWIEKGSSYNKIFDEAYELYNIQGIGKELFIEEALKIFRNFDPMLSLSIRAATILEYYANRYTLFLITDGNPLLQRKKFEALGLSKYFKAEMVVFTGDYCNTFHKPNHGSLTKIDLTIAKSVYFGDRYSDQEFATKAGMQFQKVYNMIPLNE